jgi:hypothetical protein
MKPKIPLNPFEEQSEEYHKNPKDMSLEELELLLYTKRMELYRSPIRIDNNGRIYISLYRMEISRV